MKEPLKTLLENAVPVSVLAPMQDVTTLPFMRLLKDYGLPDYFVTEFLRVHSSSSIDKDIEECLENPIGNTPLFLQLIGEDVPALSRIARETLSRFPIAGIDLNLGCPAPKVYKKNVGGGLLRDLQKVEEILKALRELCSEFGKLFTLKCRLGFDSEEPFPKLLELIDENKIDLLAVHGRTVQGLYRSPVNYNAIAKAVKEVNCPVIANGEISSVEKAIKVKKQTNCAGWMLGRHAIRNPWIFRQLKETREGKDYFRPKLKHLFKYIQNLENCVKQEGDSQERIAARMKKFLNFIGTGIDLKGEFIYKVRRAETPTQIFKIAEYFLLSGENAEKNLPLEPFPGIIARPNCE